MFACVWGDCCFVRSMECVFSVAYAKLSNTSDSSSAARLMRLRGLISQRPSSTCHTMHDSPRSGQMNRLASRMYSPLSLDEPRLPVESVHLLPQRMTRVRAPPQQLLHERLVCLERGAQLGTLGLPARCLLLTQRREALGGDFDALAQCIDVIRRELVVPREQIAPG